MKEHPDQAFLQAQRSLFSHTEEVSSPVPVFQDDSQHAFANEDEHRNHFQRIANLVSLAPYNILLFLLAELFTAGR